MTQEEFERHRAAEIAKLKAWDEARTGQIAAAEVVQQRIEAGRQKLISEGF